ncbi:SGNH/GDSL hydrolase family protein [Rivibacter subsaxonicus]|uniref:Lysophospholipase L1-like esterase n=1 Tax=Rivibacter subsaxonicus TaxID=457575 RepID=A0A4Q7VV35_9BURK|nr:SGNH/GDSL hydrolase family protein [Rivibacter subsaxonicus]RZU00514.1 lysophospholipase L1-like esterase [Rivibacter subsaxonicus]
MTMLAKIALGPVLLAQARAARKRAVPLPEAAGPRDGELGGQGQPISLLFVGDSSAAGVGVTHLDAAFVGHLTRNLHQLTGRHLRWRVAARSGISTDHALSLLDTLDAEAPGTRAALAIVLLGVNDVIEQIPPHRALLGRQALLERLRARHGVRHVVFTPLPPMHEFPLLPNPLRAVVGRDARRLDAAVARWAADRHDASHPLIDMHLGPEVMAADGFHPGEPVYRVCGQAVAEHIAQRVLPMLDDKN